LEVICENEKIQLFRGKELITLWGAPIAINLNLAFREASSLHFSLIFIQVSRIGNSETTIRVTKAMMLECKGGELSWVMPVRDNFLNVRDIFR
jgi:hypothetical protein